MSCQARWADTQYEPHFLKLRAFISVAQAILAGKYGRFVRNLLPCASCVSILEQNLRGKPRLAVFTNPRATWRLATLAENISASVIPRSAMRRVTEKSSFGDFSFFALRYCSSRTRLERLLAQKTNEAPEAMIDVKIDPMLAPTRSHSSNLSSQVRITLARHGTVVSDAIIV